LNLKTNEIELHGTKDYWILMISRVVSHHQKVDCFGPKK